MILLTSINDKLQVITGQSVSTIFVHASHVDYNGGTVTPNRTNTAITTTTTTDVVAAPAVSTQRNVKTIIIRNSHATSSCDITVQHTDGTTVAQLFKYTLLAGESILYQEQRFQVRTAPGLLKLAIDGSAITSGLVGLARGGTNVDLSASGGTTAILAQDASHVISARNLVAADIPNLDGSKITTGTVAAARVGQINLAASGNGGVTGNLPVGNLGGAVGANSGSVWRGDQVWATGVVGNWTVIGTLLLNGNGYINRTRSADSVNETGPVVISNDDHAITLVWTGAGLDLYVDGQPEGTITTH